jgi:hypothetical protein
MNPTSDVFLAVARRWLTAGLLVLVLCSRGAAQSAPEQRWLFVFDTSFAMKKCLPGTEAEIRTLLFSSVGLQLHTGDSVGVWTFGRELRVGRFPLVTWDAEQAALMATNLAALVHKQSYTGDTSWSALQPLLGQVIRDSERLTIVIFCDGLGTVDWTPYNDGINRTFTESLAERKKARQPFVLLVRTQRGQFTGCTINFPPGALNVPPFPPLPEPVKTTPASPPPVVVKPAPVVVPSLIIVGRNVGTNLNVLTKSVSENISAPATNPPVAPVVPVNNLAVSNPPAPAVLINPVPPVPPPQIGEVKILPPVSPPAPVAPVNVLPVATAPTNAAVAPAVPANLEPTNAAPATVADDADHAGRVLKYVGMGLFVAAAGLIVFLWARALRRPRGSLITRSMQNDPRPPPRQ